MRRRFDRLLSSWTRRSPHRKVYTRSGSSSSGKAEKVLLRVMVLSAVLLAVFQMKAIIDPVDFYLKIAGDIDTPAFQYDQHSGGAQSGDQTKHIALTFETEPENAPVAVYQNDTQLGLISRNKAINVEAGTVTLDAAQISYPVTVRIILNHNTYTINLNGDRQSFEVQFKS